MCHIFQCNTELLDIHRKATLVKDEEYKRLSYFIHNQTNKKEFGKTKMVGNDLTAYSDFMT